MAKTLLRLLLLMLSVSTAGFAQQPAPEWEFFGGYSVERTPVRAYFRATPIIYTTRELWMNLHGWELSVTENINSRWGGTFQATGHYKSPVVNGSKNQERIHSFLYGPLFSHRMGWATPYAHVLFGVGHTSVRVSPGPSDKETSFVAAVGVGLDLKLGRKTAVRVFQIQYTPMTQLVSKDHSFQASVGFVFYLGERN